MGSLEADRPFARSDLHGRAVGAGLSPAGVLPPAAVDVGAGIGWILQNIADPGAIRLSPNDVLRRWPEQGTNGQRQATGAQIAHHGPGALQFPELGEDETQARLHFLIWIEDDGAGAIVGRATAGRGTDMD